MAEQNNNEVMSQPIGITPPPWYATYVGIDPETKKIPLDLKVSSTDWVAVGAIVLSLLAFVITFIAIRSSTKAQIESNKELISSQNIKLLKEIEWEKEKQWLSSFKVISANYISTITKILYQSQMLEEKYLDETYENKINESTKVGHKLEEVRSLIEMAILVTCELDLHLSNNRKEHQEIIYLCDYYNQCALTLIEEYFMVKSRDQLTKLVYTGAVRSSDEIAGELYSNEDIQAIANKPKIEVLSFFMRKITEKIKNVINEKAA